MPGFSRNVETGELWIQRWVTGLITQRSPLFTPLSALGLQILARLDALIDGLNVEISPIMTVVRRPAYTRFSSVTFGAGDIPLNYYSFQNTSGTIRTVVDATNNVYQFTSSTNTVVLAKTTTARGDFFRVGDYLYYCNGTDTKFWDGTTWSGWGITRPANAPTLGFVPTGLTAQSGYQYGYSYVNTVTGHVSSMSPTSANTGPQTNQTVNVTYAFSTDPQVNTIWLWRTVDGGGIYYFLAAVPNSGATTYGDNHNDLFLNTLIIAPLSPNNAPVPATSSLITFWDGRLWTAAGRIVYWSQGAQTITGVPDQAWNLTTNFFKMPINVTGFAPTSQGLFVFTTDTTWIITGTGGVYFINPWQINFGVKAANNITQDGDLVFVYTSRGQLFQIAVTQGLTEIGQPIRAQLAAMTAKNVSIALHRSGQDEGIFVSDGATNVYRYSLTFQCWSPAGQPTQTAGVIKSIETSDSIWTLLLGGTAGAKYIGARTLGNWTDDGGTYTGFVTVGSIILGGPGTTKFIESLCLNLTRTGTYPSVYVMLNEINTSGGAGFSLLPNPTMEPPTLAPESQSLFTRRHYLKAGHITTGGPIPQLVQHMQVKISFFAENFGSELLGLAILPKLPA